MCDVRVIVRGRGNQSFSFLVLVLRSRSRSRRRPPSAEREARGAGDARRPGRTSWPPCWEISGEEAQARTRFSWAYNEGATKCTGARARPEPCAAKPEPPDHRARGSTRAARSLRVSYSAKAIGGCQFAQLPCPKSVSQLRI
jgi:hypothetical protein